MQTPKLLLIDGYNVIHRIPELKISIDAGLENARLKIALLISAWSHSHPGTESMIIFDGDLKFSGSRDQRLAGIRCLFTHTPHGADAEIIRFIRDYKGKKSDITVVSDDNSVRNSCRAHGAAVQPSSFILTTKSRPSTTAKMKSSSYGKGINPKAAADINKELKKKFGL